MINEDLVDENMDNSEIEIDPNDLLIIYDNHNWKPTKELIRAYAEQLEFDVNNDPPEMLSIAEKYLTKDIPDQFRRAFHKKTLQLVYINTITKEVELSSEFEEAAKEEYKVIDVSHHQGNINWTRVKEAGIEGAIIRSGISTNKKKNDDEYFYYYY